MSKRAPFHPDPRTKLVASRLMADAMVDVSRRMLAGQDHYTARSDVLHELAPVWSEIAGKPAADAAVRGLHCLGPTEYLTTGERQRYDAQRKAERLAELARYRPKANTRLNRWWIRLTGMALYGLVLAAGGSLAGPGQAEARDDRWLALAACGRATMGTTEYERRCRQFSRTERSTVRDYDFSGAGGPREWELPREWE